MTDGTRIAERARAAREHVTLSWDDSRVELLLARTHARRRRRAVVRIALTAAIVIVLVSLGAIRWLAQPGPQVADVASGAPSAAPAAQTRVVQLADGSRISPLTEDADIVVSRVTDEEIRIDLGRGGARFDVVRGLPRTFQVVAGQVEVTVLGTVFEVWREARGARVRVVRGRVQVRWPGGDAVLEAGDDRHFDADERAPPSDRGRSSITAAAGSEGDPHASGADPSADEPGAQAGAPAEIVPVSLTTSIPDARTDEPSGDADAADSNTTASNATASNATASNATASNARADDDAPRSRDRAARAARRRPSPAPVAPPTWVALAEAGSYEEAAAQLDEDSRLIERGDLEQLMLAADTMRLTGQPDRALALLNIANIVADGDGRAPLVEFTRGRLLLTALERPAEAAEAFERARSLAPRSSLAGDALAREVEALARAGDAASALAHAEEYLREHPNGLRAAAVRRWGGVPQ